MAGSELALRRYEVTVGEYRAFASATGGTGNDLWRDHDRFPQTDRHPVAYVSWNDAGAYLSWPSRTTGETYRLPMEAEWERAASRSRPGCDRLGRGTWLGRGTQPGGTCPAGTNGSNAAGLSDMVGNVWEWTSGWLGGQLRPSCGSRRLVVQLCRDLRLGARGGFTARYRSFSIGFRVSRTLD